MRKERPLPVHEKSTFSESQRRPAMPPLSLTTLTIPRPVCVQRTFKAKPRAAQGPGEEEEAAAENTVEERREGKQKRACVAPSASGEDPGFVWESGWGGDDLCG